MKNEPCNLCSCHESTSSHDKWNAITFGIVEANEQNAIIAIKFVVRFPRDHAWNAIRTFVKSRIENALEKRTHPIHVRTHIELSILLLIIIIIAHVHNVLARSNSNRWDDDTRKEEQNYFTSMQNRRCIHETHAIELDTHLSAPVCLFITSLPLSRSIANRCVSGKK